VRPILRETLRAARNPAAIVAVVLLLATGTLTPRLAAPEPAASPVYYAVSANYSGGYQFNFLAYGSAGNVLEGVPISLLFYAENYSGGPPLKNLSGATNSHGFLAFDWTHPQCRCGLEMVVKRAIYDYELPDPASSILTSFNSFVFSVRSEGLFESRPSQLVVGFPDDVDSVPSGTSLEVCVTSPGGTPPPCTPRSLGAVTELPQAFPIRDLGPQSDAARVHYSLVNQSGATIGTYNVSYGSLDPTDPSNAVVTNAGSSLQTAVPTISFVVALAAVLVGYTTYGRDRLNGSLDPVLALPVTRRRLILSRYAASLAVVGSGAAMGAVILGLALPAVSNTPVPPTIWIGLIAAFVGEAAIFVGLVFLAAHLTRSGSLLLVGLVLFVTLLTLLWDPLVVVLGRSLGLTATRSLGSTGYLMNPAESAVSIVGYLAFRLDGGRPLLIPTLTNPGLLSALVVTWAVVPILLAWVIFQVRD